MLELRGGTCGLTYFFVWIVICRLLEIECLRRDCKMLLKGYKCCTEGRGSVQERPIYSAG